MWKIIALIVLLVAVWYFVIRKRSVEGMTDEQKIGETVEKIRSMKPELVPLDTVSVDGPSSRILFLNTKTYAGEMYDASVKEDGSVQMGLTTSTKATIKEETNVDTL